jgi:hypothetical protein
MIQILDFHLFRWNIMRKRISIFIQNREINEAEDFLSDRIDQKIGVITTARSKMEAAGEKGADSELIKTSFLNDTIASNITLKVQDLVGIDLEHILRNPGSKEDLILFEGDVIQIPKQLQTVRMVGEVLLPTTARYDELFSVKKYVSKAGGFSESARRSKVYVIYANGDVKSTQNFLGMRFYPNVEPGAEIIVPKKPFKQRMGAAGWVGLATSMATFGILVNTLINQK